ncbi:hypothetical protein [Ralstonia pickettii]|nr:hypothetical protein [Ralstonia pickettii]
MPTDLGQFQFRALQNSAENGAGWVASGSRKNAMTTKLTDKQEAVLAFASQHGTIDFYQASELGANGSTLASMTKKGWLAKQECNGLNDWIATDAGKALLPVQRR